MRDVGFLVPQPVEAHCIEFALRALGMHAMVGGAKLVERSRLTAADAVCSKDRVTVANLEPPVVPTPTTMVGCLHYSGRVPAAGLSRCAAADSSVQSMVAYLQDLLAAHLVEPLLQHHNLDLSFSIDLAIMRRIQAAAF